VTYGLSHIWCTQSMPSPNLCNGPSEPIRSSIPEDLRCWESNRFFTFTISESFAIVKCCEIRSLSHAIDVLRGLGRIGMTRFLIGAGGVNNEGCPAPMYFYDACTRVWRVREKTSGTGQTKTAEYPRGQSQLGSYLGRLSGRNP
jgi:hypothetical protein